MKILRETRISNMRGWSGDTVVQVNGIDYEITTMKRHNGLIVADAQKGNYENKGAYYSFSYTMFADKSYKLLSRKSKATKQAITDFHEKALEAFKEMADLLPTANKKIEVGQVISTWWGAGGGDEKDRVIYQIKDNMALHIGIESLEFDRTEINHIKPWSEKFGIGTYYYPEQTMPESKWRPLLEQALEKVEKIEAERPAKEAEAKRILEENTNKLIKEYAHLTPLENGGDCAKNIRLDLKENFKGIKFSVRKDHNSVNIKWTDGPTQKQVEDITGKYTDHKTDITGDFRDYDPSLFNRIFGGANFIFERRDISDKSDAIIMKWANETWEKDNPHQIHNPRNLAYRLIQHYPIYGEFKVVKNDETKGGTWPNDFFMIVPLDWKKPEKETKATKTPDLITPAVQAMIKKIKEDGGPLNHPVMICDPESNRSKKEPQPVPAKIVKSQPAAKKVIASFTI